MRKGLKKKKTLCECGTISDSPVYPDPTSYVYLGLSCRLKIQVASDSKRI